MTGGSGKRGRGERLWGDNLFPSRIKPIREKKVQVDQEGQVPADAGLAPEIQKKQS